jgi:threonine aldolase
LGTSARLRAAGATFHDMPAPEGMEGARLVTSWATTEAEVEALLHLL